MKRRKIRWLISLRRLNFRMFRQPSLYNSIHRIAQLDGIIVQSDMVCIEQLKMDCHTFNILISFVREVWGSMDTKNMVVEELVAMFLHIPAF